MTEFDPRYPRAGERYTPEEDDEIKRLYLQHEPVLWITEIAEKVGRPPDALEKHIVKLGIANRAMPGRKRGDHHVFRRPRRDEYTPEELERITQLYYQTDPRLSLSQIGEAVGRNKNQIVGVVHRLKLEARASPIKRHAP